MILLVSGATVTTSRLAGHPHLGWLAVPRCCPVATRTVQGWLWAADNDCYQRLDRAAYIAMLKRIAAADTSRLLFVSVPDVVGDAAATMLRWQLWRPVLRHYGLPAAFVAQDGQQIAGVPWSEMAALFIGGSTRFKERESGPLIAEAKRRGLWVHAGRVNTLRRAELMGCPRR
jgi:hypothetical protein